MMLPVERKLNFGISNCRELYDKLQFERDRAEKTQYKNAYDVFNFIVTAHHLHDDWLNKDESSRPKLACRKMNKAPKGIKLMVKVIKDLANGNKHMVLDDKGFNNKVIDAIHPDEIRDWTSYFHGPHFWILVGGYYLNTPALVDLVMSYFEWVFDDLIPVDDFPIEIEKQLEKAACATQLINKVVGDELGSNGLAL